MMNLALNYRWISASLHLEARDSIVVNVVLLEVALKRRKDVVIRYTQRWRKSSPITHHSIIESENSDITSMMNVIFTHDR